MFYRFLKEKCPSCWLARLSGKQRFLIHFNVLDLVYNQTVLWVGVFYCPLLPFLGLVKLVAAFYFKKVRTDAFAFDGSMLILGPKRRDSKPKTCI